MTEAHLIAGDCTTTYRGDRAHEKRGRAVCLRKPDDTVLVHDADGYRPVAWLTRPEATVVAGDPPTVEARDGDARLRVLFHAVSVDVRVPVSPAGEPVGPCPDCDGTLVRRSGRLACTDCDRVHGLPDGATVRDERCDCGLPRLEVTRGERFEVCADRTCDPLDPKVESAFDRAFDCPACGDDLRVVRAGGLFLGCDAYPDCEAAFSLPASERVGTCDCGLPTFASAEGPRCLDAGCPSP
ncbi:topoisomerase DNA-binding C4 zinc finger domain-containing protein [Halorarius halobius]|uniref:topoisomerase DNA-binding C4 zinc finger domain-containing protein n=1 Tax=Halorarius halobius TaxID=2962671 RepID=UPI0020CFB47F|nr:topoisomerase DNA-binding C4 zinc finger domain-containing protein [Halorarius halobius]